MTQQEIKIPNFTFDEKGKCLHAKVSKPIFNLIGSRLLIPNHPEIEGFVVELFLIIDTSHTTIREPNIAFEIGDWYLRIKIFDGWDQFKELSLSTFYLTEDKSQIVDADESKLSENAILLKLRNVSAKYFDNYYIDVRGGETGGAGRNEHGAPHFHIIRNGGRKDLGKVYFPTVENYRRNQVELEFSANVSQKMRKEINAWAFGEDQKNLDYLNSVWSTLNKHNNRTE